MTSYNRQELEDMNDEDLTQVYASIKKKKLPLTKTKEEAISEILGEMTPKKSKVSAPERPTLSTIKKPVTMRKSTMKTPPVPVTTSVVPDTMTRKILEKEIVEEGGSQDSFGSGSGSIGSSGSSGPRRRGRPRKEESLEKERQKAEREREQEEILLSPRRGGQPMSKIDSIKKSAMSAMVLNPKASFQKPDVIIERQREYIQPIVVSDVNISAVALPVQEEAKQTISDFLHSIGYNKQEEVPEPTMEEAPIVIKPPVSESKKSVRITETKTTKKVPSVPLVPSLPVVPSGPSVRLAPSVTSIGSEAIPSRRVPPSQAPVLSLLDKEMEELTSKISKLEVEKESEKVTKTKRTRRPVIVSQVTATGEKVESIQPREKSPSPVKIPSSQKPASSVMTSLEGLKFTKKSPIKSPIQPVQKQMSVEDLVQSLEGLSFRKSPKRMSPVEQEEKIEQVKEPEPLVESPETARLGDIVLKRKKPRRKVVETIQETEEEPVQEKVQEKAKESEEINFEDIPLIRKKPKKKEIDIDMPLIRKTSTSRAPVEVEKEVPEMTTVIPPSKPMVVKKTKVEKEIQETEEGPVEVVKKVEKKVEEVKPPSRPASLLRPKLDNQTIKDKLVELQVERSKISTQRGAKFYGIEDLKNILREIGKSTVGNKSELAERLVNVLNEVNF